ncbi:hypothetical protein CEP54_002082 [Fusarium duplospermum]|uniref:Uncharacterized protein n=1 Tax=Fusarium duplospermum TaxID=1325734 RepID=A0A428QY15_9HYPO|nr:hypothetical protein CEP54_002082 [Fusarium duplospermum]
MNHHQAQQERPAERSALSVIGDLVAKAFPAFLIVLYLRIALGHTVFAWILIVIVSGDVKAQNLPFPHLVISFLVILGLLELLDLFIRFCHRCIRRIFVWFAIALCLAHFYRFSLG